MQEFSLVKHELAFGKDFHEGVYFVEVSSGNDEEVMKVIKE